MGTNTPSEFRVDANNKPEIEYPQKRNDILTFLEKECAAHSLTSITIRNFKLDPRAIAEEDPGAPRLAAVLRSCPMLHSLDLKGSQITGWGPIAQALAFCPLLVTLDVTDCRIGQHAQAFAPCMYASTALTTLNLSSIHLPNLQWLRCITDALQQCISLRHLELANNSLTNESAPLLALALPHCTNLQHLDLSDNSLGDETGAHLALPLTQLPMLEHLNLSGNYLGATSAGHLAWALPRCMALRHVNLQDNSIGPDAVLNFGINQVGTRLTYLNLSLNLINIPVDYTYGSMLYVHSLIHLILNGNRLGNNYVRNLLYELPLCTAMTELDLRLTSVGDAGVQTLPHVIRTRPLLTRLLLTGNPHITESTRILIRNAWQETHGSMDGLQLDDVVLRYTIDEP
jgi:Ran GTPase-activating protein (RanGAP) involved in mRNA processing and transport